MGTVDAEDWECTWFRLYEEIVDLELAFVDNHVHFQDHASIDV